MHVSDLESGIFVHWQSDVNTLEIKNVHVKLCRDVGPYNHFLKLQIKDLQCLLYRNIADVSRQKHFTDFDYLSLFSRYERFGKPRYL